MASLGSAFHGDYEPQFLVNGLLMIFVGAPLALANAVVYGYVSGKIAAEQKEKAAAGKGGSIRSVTGGTPWERDPGHTK